MSLTPPFAANELWWAFGAETTFGEPAPTVYYAGTLARNDLPMLRQRQNQRADWATGCRTPISFTPGAQMPEGRVRVEPLPTFGRFAGPLPEQLIGAFGVTPNPDSAPYQFPTLLPSYTNMVGGHYMSGQPFVYVWTGCVVRDAMLSWAEGEKLQVAFGWENAFAWIQYNWDLDITAAEINVGEKPLNFDEGVFFDSGLQGIEYSHLIRSGRIRMTRRLHRAYGSGAQALHKLAARGCWNIKVLSHTIGADFTLFAPDGFAGTNVNVYPWAANVGANAPKWLGDGTAELTWTDAASGNGLHVSLFRVHPNDSSLAGGRAEDLAMFGMDWVAADWRWQYLVNGVPQN